MMGTLFRLAFRLSLVPALLLVGAVLAIVTSGEHLIETRSRVTNLGPFPDLLIWTFVIWSGFPVGSRLFSREFRERHFLLLQGLPVSRLRSWMSLVLGALASGLISVTLVLLMRPPAFVLRETDVVPSNLMTEGIWMAGPLVGLYLVFFSAGACYGLLLNGTVLHSVGLVATLGLLTTLATWLLHFHFFGEVEPLALLHPMLEHALTLLALLPVLYLLLSYLVYARGEFPVSWVRWRGLSVVLVAHVGFLAAVWGVATVRVRRAPFSMPGRAISYGVSPHGRFVSVVDQREGYPRFARVNVVEVSTGRLQGQAEIEGLVFLEWAPDGRSLAAGTAGFLPELASDQFTGELRYQGVSVVWVSSAGRPLGRVPLEHPVVALRQTGSGVLAELVKEESRSLVDLGAEPDATPAELASTEAAGRWTVRKLPEGAYVAVWNPGGRRAGRVLRLGASTEELRFTGQPRSLLDGEIRVLGSTAFAGDALEQELNRRLPPAPGAGPHTVQRIVWDYLDERPWSYALVSQDGANEADVWALPPGAEAWQRLLGGLPWVRERDHFEDPVSSPCVALSPLRYALCFDGMVARQEPGGGEVFSVADLATGSEQRIAGSLHHFERVSRHVAIASVEAVRSSENPVSLSPSGLVVYSIPFRASFGSWSEAAGGVIYQEFNDPSLRLWTPGSSESSVLWPLRE